MDVQGVLLTGGASSRMGEDKAHLLIDGVPLARRIADALLGLGLSVVVLGREPLEGCDFRADQEEYQGPLVALRQFKPSAEYVFVCSCDLPRFDVRLVSFLRERIRSAQVAVPEVNGWRQPLCALYSRSAFDVLGQIDARGPMRWLDALEAVVVSERELTDAGLDPLCTQGANTKEELAKLVAQKPVISDQ